jgi:hypothetical protein
VHASGRVRLVRERQGHAARKHPKPTWWGFDLTEKVYVSAFSLKTAMQRAEALLRLLP